MTVYVSTRHDTMASFPTVKDFEAQSDTVLKWRDLPLGIFKVLSKRPTLNKFGPGMLLELENDDGEVFHCWAPSRLVKKLNDDTAINFVLNEGLKQTVSDPAKSYFAFSCMARAS